ncbi:MAG: DUF1080 domain-containing protein [Planctomycetota bacterium]|nr:MAG: DUF1080 domain-containing protein [Planctomycetota bacterium]
MGVALLRWQRRRSLLLGSLLLSGAVVGFFVAAAAAADSPDANAGQFEAIFNGRTLDGWHAVPAETAGDWSVADGAIVGCGSQHRQAYLVYDDENLADFELKFEYRLRTEGNTGVELRARPDESGKRAFEGYHADLGHVGIGPHILGAWDFHFAEREEPACLRGTRLVIEADGTLERDEIAEAVTKADIRPRDWNQVHVVARGNHLQLLINDKLSSEFVDRMPRWFREGAIGLQLHEKDTVVEFRELRLKRLTQQAQPEQAQATKTPRGSGNSLAWRELPPLPDDEGFAGMFAGVSGDAVIAAGGANFPAARPWDGGEKRWYDTIFVFDQRRESWQLADARLPHSLAYGVSVTHRDRVICVGGEDGQRARTEVFALTWNGSRLERSELPPLPEARTQMCGALVGDVVYLAGGLVDPAGTEAANSFWALNLSAPAAEQSWQVLPTWPGPARMQAVAAAHEGRFYLFSGVQLKTGADGKPQRVVPYLRDAYCYTPVPEDQTGAWRPLADLPRPAAAAPSPAFALGHAHLVIAGGATEPAEPDQLATHPGFTRELLAYHPTTDRWSRRGEVPTGASRVTAPTVSLEGATAVVSGEARPGVRSPQVWVAKFHAPMAEAFGATNWLVLAAYLLVLVGIGGYFAMREKTTDDFFLGGRRVPWWAAGLSVFATQLSAITYLAIPARSFGTNWQYFLISLGILAVAPLVVYVYLPWFRAREVTSAYEVLERRFGLSVRLFGSASFIAFQLGRMGIVVLLPALALSAVTGLNVFLCIAVMGLLSTLYTVLGGIEAVIWTDVLQVFVLLGGALAALAIVAFDTDGGLGRVISAAAEQDKFRLADWQWDWTGDAIGVLIVGALFTNLVQYTTDQAVVQRYLSTRDERRAARAVWTNALLSVPAAALFFLVGTALFVFYQQRPAELATLAQADQIFPWFIASEMPVGLAGLVIAGVFAAAMSSLDSSMHSIATAVTTDFVVRLGPSRSDTARLRIARGLTLILGLLGTATAMMMATLEVLYLWDLFLALVGLLGGTLAGLFLLGVFTKRPTATHAWCGIVASLATLTYVKFATPLAGLTYAGIGAVVCFGGAILVATVLPAPRNNPQPS